MRRKKHRQTVDLLKENKVVLTVTVEHHLPVTALFNYNVCLAMMQVPGSQFQLRINSQQQHPIGKKSGNDWISEKLCEWGKVLGFANFVESLGMGCFEFHRYRSSVQQPPPLQMNDWKNTCLCRAVEYIIVKTSAFLNIVKGLCWL